MEGGRRRKSGSEEEREKEPRDWCQGCQDVMGAGKAASTNALFGLSAYRHRSELNIAHIYEQHVASAIHGPGRGDSRRYPGALHGYLRPLRTFSRRA